jgi:hypothetical protein
MADTSSWLPNLLGPLDLQVGGVDVDVPRRSTINLINMTVTDDAVNQCTVITGVPGGGGGFTPPTGTGLVTVTAGVLNAASTPLGAGVATWLTTPNGANLAAALTTVVPVSKTTPATIAVAALAIDWSLSNAFSKTLSAGANAITFSNQSSGQTIIVRLTGAASTVSWPTVRWPGGTVPTQTASGTDVYTFFFDGTNTYGSVVQAMA